MNGPDWLTVRELAKALRLSRMSVYRAVEAGEIEHYRFGRQIRIRRAAADAYVKQAHRQLERSA